MYAYSTTIRINQPVDFAEPPAFEEIHYWRKHPNLHGWMERLYRRKGGTDTDFNLSAVRLDPADLDVLEAAVLGRKLPETSGFFFGQSDGSEQLDDLSFIAKAREEIAAGKTVFYLAWW
jgi:hypothetical protein